MKKFGTSDLIALLVWLISPAYLLLIYASLPDTVPLHYGVNGTPDRFGPKSEMFIGQGILTGVALLTYLLVRYLPSIDPKKKAQYDAGVYQKIALTVMLLLSALGIVITYSTLHHGVRIDKLILPLIGLFFAVMGNLMHSVKPNYFVGIRTPWTLEDEGTWRATHQFASKFWMIGGILLTIGVLLMPGRYAIALFMPGILVIALVPVIYSYLYYKKHRVS